MHSVMKQSPANTQIQNMIFCQYGCSWKKSNFLLIAVDLREDLQH